MSVVHGSQCSEATLSERRSKGKGRPGVSFYLCLRSKDSLVCISIYILCRVIVMFALQANLFDISVSYVWPVAVDVVVSVVVVASTVSSFRPI